MKWTEREIGQQVHNHVFRGRHLVCVPNCLWTGFEADLLVVRRDLRLVDVEIKVSRQDLRADAAKDKWFDFPDWQQTWGMTREQREAAKTPRTHPVKIWKHYYAMPRAIFTPELEAAINPHSGILLVSDPPRDDYHHPDRPRVYCHRHGKPSRDAQPISMDDLCHIAILQSHRMWDAWDEVDIAKRSAERAAEKAA
jgi:hypothetical protein